MNDFLKIFLVLCSMVAAFFVGKGYGEQTFLASDDYKNIAKTKDELDYARNELENAKAKLQNIVNGAGNQKTDELLAQILQVFLADLGLQIQNRDLILQQAKNTASAGAPAKPEQKPSEVQPLPMSPKMMAIAKQFTDPTPTWALTNSKTDQEEKRRRQLKSDEWMLLNSEFNKKLLNRVTLKNFKEYLANANPEIAECDAYLGRFKGSFKGEDGSSQGSISFELRNDKNIFEGKVSWMNSPNPPISTNISGNCGLRADPLMARFFTLSDTLSLQVYPISDRSELIGNMYEKLAAGTVKKVGTFRIRRLNI